MLGFLGYAQSVMDTRELSPEVFLRVTFIEGYVEFLKVGVFVFGEKLTCRFSCCVNQNIPRKRACVPRGRVGLELLGSGFDRNSTTDVWPPL